MHQPLSTLARVDEEVMHGGVANAGAVVRSGDHVLRPPNPNSVTIHAALSGLYTAGFRGASRPIGIDPDGRERLEFIPGDVPLPPYPEWVQSNDALGSIAQLLVQLHDASVVLDLTTGTWSDEMRDPLGGAVLCHNDVCLENVVFRDERAVGLLDFDFAAPGRRVFDIASFARMCVPIDDEINAARLGWLPADRAARLRLIADIYGFDKDERAEVMSILDSSIEVGGEFVRRHVEAGEPGFVQMWAEMGGSSRFDRRRKWWELDRDSFDQAMQ
jgi:Phosphotransferase enzyme family